MSLLKIAHIPPPTVAPNATVLEAIRTMQREGVGAVAVVDKEQLRGIFTERDVTMRVALKELDPGKTRVGEVMTAQVHTASDSMTEGDALTSMIEHHVRHLAIVSEKGKLQGMLSIRNVLEHQVDLLSRELHSLDQYLSNDGPGG